MPLYMWVSEALSLPSCYFWHSVSEGLHQISASARKAEIWECQRHPSPGIHNDQFTSIMIGIPVIQDIVTPRDLTSTGNTSKTIVLGGVFPDIVLFRYSLVTSCQVSTKVVTLTARQDWHLTMSHSKHLIEIKSHWLIHLGPSPWGPIGFLSWHKKVVIALIESN